MKEKRDEFLAHLRRSALSIHPAVVKKSAKDLKDRVRPPTEAEGG